MSTTQVYVKTPKGIEEMNSRSFGLTPRLRRVLIMVDGKRKNEEIIGMFTDGDSAAMLESLIQDSFIVPLLSRVATPDEQGDNNSSVAAAPVQPNVTTPAKPIEPVAPPLDDAQRFDMAKNFMINTIKAFLGGMGSGLVNQLEKCSNLDELRPHYKAWRETIVLTRDGRKQADELEKRLAALLS
jgi:hypothetical protein